MPKQYEAMRDKFIKGGMSVKKAKTKAARIYNSRHSEEPVTRSHESDRYKVKRLK